jgi:hypothetical protein
MLMKNKALISISSQVYENTGEAWSKSLKMMTFAQASFVTRQTIVLTLGSASPYRKSAL